MLHKKLYRFFLVSSNPIASVHVATGPLEYGRAAVMNLLELYDRRGEQLDVDWLSIEQYTIREDNLVKVIPESQFFAMELDADVKAFIFQQDAWVRWVPTLPLR